MKLLGLFIMMLVSMLQVHAGDDVARDLSDLTQFFQKNRSAHDIIIKDHVVVHGYEQSYYDEFYQVVNHITANFKRSIMVIDVMPEYGYCPFKLMSSFNATAVLLTEDTLFEHGVRTSDILSKLGALYGVDDRLMVLNYPLDKNGLRYLSECEHFDLVLVSNLLKLCGSRWQELYKAIFALGQMVIMGIATDGIAPGMYREACALFDQKGGALIKTITKENYEARFYTFFQKKGSVKNCALNDSKPHPPHAIDSNYYKKVFIKDGIERPWYSGVNLLTFRALHGVVPSEDFILDELEHLAPFAPKGANTIIQGKNLFILP